MNREELAWAAGFVDGEGTFSCKMRDTESSRKGYPTFSIQQSGGTYALDRLEQALKPVIVKRYGPYGPYKTNIGKQSHYRLEAYGFEKVQAIMTLLWTWLGPIKRAQAVSVLYNKESQPWGREQAHSEKAAGF